MGQRILVTGATGKVGSELVRLLADAGVEVRAGTRRPDLAAGLFRPDVEVVELDYQSVVTWGEGLREQWGGDPLGEEPEKLSTLEAFCEFWGKDPDELLAFCFLRRRATGERFASVKRREQVAAQLRAFRDARGVTGTPARKLVSDVLSFLIHNGVIMNPGMV